MGIVWIKALTLKTGHANVIKHVDPVLEALGAGTLDPTPLVTHHMGLDEAPDAYDVYDRREALKIVLDAVSEGPREITWEQFEAVDMRVGRIVAVERLPRGPGPGLEARDRLRARDRDPPLLGPDHQLLARGARGHAGGGRGQLPAEADRPVRLRGAGARRARRRARRRPAAPGPRRGARRPHRLRRVASIRMSDMLRTYLQDHHAGSTVGVELARRTAGSNAGHRVRRGARPDRRRDRRGPRHARAGHGAPRSETAPGQGRGRLGRREARPAEAEQPSARLLAAEPGGRARGPADRGHGKARAVGGAARLGRRAASTGVDFVALGERAEDQRAGLEDMRRRAAVEAFKRD